MGVDPLVAVDALAVVIRLEGDARKHLLDVGEHRLAVHEIDGDDEDARLRRRRRQEIDKLGVVHLCGVDVPIVGGLERLPAWSEPPDKALCGHDGIFSKTAMMVSFNSSSAKLARCSWNECSR